MKNKLNYKEFKMNKKCSKCKPKSAAFKKYTSKCNSSSEISPQRE